MRLITITPEEDVKDEQHYISLLIAEGFVVHCRKPERKAVDLAAYLRHISPEFRNSIAIHDHYELADDMGIKRLHFPERKRKEAGFSCEKYGSYQLSTSLHTRQSLDVENLTPYQYVFCAPVFDSISKQQYMGKKEWQEPLKSKTSIDKVALGGMVPEKMLTVSQWGYEGIAFSGYLWENPEKIKKRIKKIKKVWLKDLTL